MHSLNYMRNLDSSQFEAREKSHDFNKIDRERSYHIALGQIQSALELDFSGNPSLILYFEEKAGSQRSTQTAVGILVNQDHSCWITNLGPNEFIEVFRSEGSVHRSLDYNQVAYVRQGDLVSFGGHLFRLLFGFSSVQLKAIQADIKQAEKLQ